MKSLTVEDRLALQDLAVRYARGVDRRDRALFLSAFHPDATLIVPSRQVPSGQVLAGHDQIGDITEAIKRFDRTFHFLGQSAYEPPDEGLDPAGTARGEVYCIAYHWTAGRPAWVMHIRYQDTYRRGEAGWRIAARRVVVDATRKEQDA
jgi:hypothetical protein